MWRTLDAEICFVSVGADGLTLALELIGITTETMPRQSPERVAVFALSAQLDCSQPFTHLCRNARPPPQTTLPSLTDTRIADTRRVAGRDGSLRLCRSAAPTIWATACSAYSMAGSCPRLSQKSNALAVPTGARQNNAG